ncbi:MAG: N-acetylneuraminate synthase family protein [Cyanobacteria bacterium]|nr:N-acetylneuraminate synthase family protein [Cyanobacteriota bacterium]
MTNTNPKAGYWANLPKPCVIAEIGVNHNGDVTLAKQLIDAAKACGAHVAKFQSFTADNVTCKNSLSAEYMDEGLGVKGTVYDLLNALSLSHDDQLALKSYCQKQAIPFVSTPFNTEEVDFLVQAGVPFIKLSSTDLTNLPYLRYVATKKTPMLLSTGMATLDEVKAAVAAIYEANTQADVAILHCVSLYPPEPEELNLRAIQTLKQTFPNLEIGFSDHSIGTWACTAAVALGATILEKHFTLDKAMAGPDQKVSADPTELKAIIEAADAVYRSLGAGEKRPSEREKSMIPVFCRSLVLRQSIKAGEIIRAENLDYKRPATGLPPSAWESIVGQAAQVDIPADTPLTEEMVKVPAMASR